MIYLLNASSLVQADVEPVALTVQSVVGVPVRVLPHTLALERVFDSSRKQYNSSLLLTQILPLQETLKGKLIALVDVDLYVPILTFVYGEAQLDGPAAIVSLHRLRNSFYGIDENRHILIDRLTKEVIHELGHTYGLFHCHQFECVMRASTYVEEIDLKKETLCEHCSTLLSQKVKV